MKPHDPLEELMPRLKESAPEGFTRRVSSALPGVRTPAAWWPQGWTWVSPMLAGAAAALFLMLLRPAVPPPSGQDAQQPPAQVVRFELLAADAREVQLVGSFTEWETGRIQLIGPDATGHWVIELTLPEGRHEYGFLVDGAYWVSDPRAELQRDDGFGRLNAVLEI